MIFVPMAAATLVAPPAVTAAPRVAIEAAMADSAAGWNAGDLGRFMAVYSDAPETSFVTKKGLIRGKAAISERVRSRYSFSDPSKLGRLTFTTLDFRLLSHDRALYIGMYALAMPDGTVQSGPTSLVFAREKAGWRVIADHSS